jgi:hypothetical protein
MAGIGRSNQDVNLAFGLLISETGRSASHALFAVRTRFACVTVSLSHTEKADR